MVFGIVGAENVGLWRSVTELSSFRFDTGGGRAGGGSLRVLFRLRRSSLRRFLLDIVEVVVAMKVVASLSMAKLNATIPSCPSNTIRNGLGLVTSIPL